MLRIEQVFSNHKKLAVSHLPANCFISIQSTSLLVEPVFDFVAGIQTRVL
jgi:hypothetical protein